MSMPIPTGMQLATVTWKLGHTTQTESLAGARGLVRFEATATAVSYPDVTVLPSPVTARVQGGVMEPQDLTVNDPDLWNWRVTPEFGVAWAPFHIDVPAAGVDLATVVVVPGKGPIRAVTGPPGPAVGGIGDVPGLQAIIDRLTYDSGWRNISEHINPVYRQANPNATAHITRVGRVVTINFAQGRDATHSGLSIAVLSIPDGFRSGKFTARPWGSPGLDEQTGKQVTDGAGIYMESGGHLLNTFATAGKRYAFTMQYLTPDPIPTMPPGEPV